MNKLFSYLLEAEKSTRQISVQKSSSFEENYFILFVCGDTFTIAKIGLLTYDNQSSSFAVSIKSIMSVVGGSHLIYQKSAYEYDKNGKYSETLFVKYFHFLPEN